MHQKYLRSIWLLIIVAWLTGALADAPNYEQARRAAEHQRQQLAQEYTRMRTQAERSAVIAKAGAEFQRLLVKDLAPPWYGTPWNFHGTSERPAQGNIACGYFVTTLLRDMGLQVERNRLAQQASENIIKSLVSPKSIKRYRNKPLDVFLKSLRNWGTGLYIVGLDYHVGFISVEPDGTFFIHSSYQKPFAVVRDVAAQSNILASSRYRVAGKLDDARLMRRWFEDAKIKTLRR